MDSHRSRLLNYVLCELVIPVKKHVYNYVASDQSSIKHHLLTAAVKAVNQNKCKKFKSTKSCMSKKKTAFKHRLKSTDLLQPEEQIIETDFLVIDVDPTVYKCAPETEFKPKSMSNCDIRNEYDDPIDVKESTCQEQILAEHQSANAKSLEEMVTYDQTLQPDEGSQSDEKDGGAYTKLQCDLDLLSDVHDENSESFDESGFFSDPLLLCSEADFKTMFRMKRATFQKLLTFFPKEEMEPIENVPLYKKVLIVLWLMGNSGSYSEAAEVFGITEEAAANCFFDVCATLYNKSDDVIRWPSSSECTKISSRIEKRFGFPGVVGVLGCHYFSISIPKEAISRREHFNAKFRTYCIALQVVCDDRLVIRDIFPGLPGSIPEAKVLRYSPLCEQLTSKDTQHSLVKPHRHVLARQDYPQLTSMLTPYTKDASALTTDEAEFNTLHENVCQLVDQAFQMLQDRFVTLKLLDPEVATMVLVAACTLHNICLENGDVFDNQE